MTLDTTTSFLGFRLPTPLIVGACPLTLRPEMARQMVGAGASALVMPSVFEEQIECDRFGGGPTSAGSARLPSSVTFDEAMKSYNGGLSNYLDHLERLRSIASVPIIANMNGVGSGQWLSFARKLEDVGASAIEVTLYRMTIDPDEFADEIEQDYLDGLSFLCGEVNVPVIVKLLPYFTSLPNFACRISGTGAMGLTLFGRYPRSDGDLGSVNHRLQWGLTRPGDVSLSRQWLGSLRTVVPKLSLAASGGVATAEDAICLLQAGADVVMVTSEIYRSGVDALRRILEGMRTWGRENRAQFLSQPLVDEVDRRGNTMDEAYERPAATYSLTATSQTKLKHH